MRKSTALFHASSPESTCTLAQRLGAHLRPGDVLLLSGEIGAGKTHFARCLIQSRLIEPEDVPSPTFTLVQQYDTDAGELWHADLYRLYDPDHCVELGLTDAFETAICVVEWPDRLAALTPADALEISFAAPGDADDSRDLLFTWSAPRWAGIIAQALA
ncbi:tRNA (adenosine(37)-N6)-threonylcarbamoyltransferase complex ATPase subunit type 1 TsaE [Puniceibacterium sp. IMCC21224]|uniref:tRNA (adenosine(37)-N6)-threonylcarbamoyltransferase complex ATPase subunit type 1 TsaE n=1 Tax=Puniceibacterium sp. IMCC21224 TaxID=1618204 RepID=UPI00064DE2FA|nr:tRNA (adenosine(37)-N6)-threonylcarbamoyltransferase complex ATPase subunit type 1 TsaE [Puniceibacterium sp. IMCC21224]KMK65289.1 tRNA threonylcarbamoyl adenosine modification protein YjeE [Puniceibacterium sp. IMCC21224]